LDILNAELVNLIARFSNVEYRLDVIDNSITNINNNIVALQNRDDDLQNQINGITAFIGLIQSKLNLLETSVNNLESRVTNIENDLPNFLRKVTPIPGYDPYYIGGGVAAYVWLYNITPIDDNNIRFYYVQFNDIYGSPGFESNVVPLPRTFGNFIWALPHEPYAVSGKGNSFKLIIEGNTGIRLREVAGTVIQGGDYIGFLIIGNASSPGPLDEENIEKIPVEDLRKMVRKLQFQVNQLNKSDEKK
jgi:hypothetical protein